jgi:hypothetical protein
MTERKTATDVFEKLIEIETARVDERVETARWREEIHNEIADLKKRLDKMEPTVMMVSDWRRMLIGAGFALSVIGTTIAIAMNYVWVKIGFNSPPTPPT